MSHDTPADTSPDTQDDDAPGPLSDAELAEYREQIRMLPDAVRDIAERYPAIDVERRTMRCYRSSENARHHYIIRALSEPKDSSPVTLQLVHAYDSASPGVMTFGQDPAQLIPCECGHWDPPTDEQIEATREHIARCQRTGNFDRPQDTRLRLFGPHVWGLLRGAPSRRFPQPEEGARCSFCDEPVRPSDCGVALPIIAVREEQFSLMHRECFARASYGSEMHIMRRCLCHRGPDPEDPPGLSRRAAAMETLAFMQRLRRSEIDAMFF